VLMRKRKMIHKPQSYVRNMMWNNIWYRQQETPVKNHNILESLKERNIPVYSVDEVITPIIPFPEQHNLEPRTRMEEQKRDETHPLWKDEPIYNYHERTWQPRDQELQFAQAVTNTLAIGSLPQSILDKYNTTKISPASEQRLETLIKSCYIGDATQEKLPRNYEVPYIGWHPVESTMAPRNQYNYEHRSWGWKTAREYGIPNKRKLANLTRGIFKELCKNNNTSLDSQHFLENSLVKQFIRRPDGKLLRFFLRIPFMVTGRKRLENNSIQQAQDVSLPNVHPLDSTAGLKQENIYQLENNFPILSTQFSQPYVHTVVRHNEDHIAPKFLTGPERAKSLMYAYTVALGQARLLYGDEFNEDLTVPITINSISTNGRKYLISSFQLNSTKLDSAKPNFFSFHDEELELFEYCGYEKSKVVFRGYNPDTIRWLATVMTEPSPNKQQQQKISVN